MTNHHLLLALLVGIATTASARAATLQSAIEAAVASTESRVIQLRYFGDSGDTLGASAAPVTGYALGEGWVLTSLYGLGSDPAAIVALYADGSQSSLSIAGRDHNRRLVLLKAVVASPIPPAFSAGRKPRIGETAIALGRVDAADDVSLSVGIVSAVGRLGGRATQTDAAASPTNYGGPLIALDGTLLGVLSPLSPPGQSGVDLYDSGVGFAVTLDSIGQRLSRLAAGQDVWPGWLGAAFSDKDPLRSPATILKALSDGPAELAGLKKGDTILSLAGQSTRSVWALRAVLAGLDADDRIQVELKDEQKTRRTVEVTLSKRPDPPAEESNQTEAPNLEAPTKKPSGS